jgi:hypothetical protein
MQPIIYLYCMYYFSPYMFRALTGPSSGVSWAACLCCHLVHAVLLSVRAFADGGLVRGRTDRQQHCMNQMVDKQTAQDTTDNGPERARNM